MQNTGELYKSQFHSYLQCIITQWHLFYYYSNHLRSSGRKRYSLSAYYKCIVRFHQLKLKIISHRDSGIRLRAK